ncbi:hypothetical protein [Corynebacterium nasicanis]|uniref:Heparan-alpha-glucosaminide N-acetyltransferase catalytic domain-containing protein n=1 Tax=Corynebacterium nasicanis TaxID=1448267 RepID=A0ABW1QBS5_9CORY
MTRIHGLDLARALAIIGMMAAHIGPERFLTDGYPSVLFAVLAGVSMGLIASRSPLLDARLPLLTRAVLLIGLGVLLDALQFGIAVVLIAIGVSYLLLLPLLGWSTRRLLLVLAGLVVLGPLLGAAQHTLYIAWGSEFFSDLLFGPYPLTAWLAYTLLGFLLHRLALHRELWLLVGGVVVFVLAQGIIEVSGFRVGAHDGLNFLGEWLQGAPHSGGLLDVLTSAGLATAVIGVCLLACRVGAIVWATYPLRSLGAMSLTVYVTHVLITSVANGTVVSFDGLSGEVYSDYVPEEYSEYAWSKYPPELDKGDIYDLPLWPELFLWQLLGFLVFASLWRWRFRRGPAEWAMHRAVGSTAGGQPEKLT